MDAVPKQRSPCTLLSGPLWPTLSHPPWNPPMKVTASILQKNAEWAKHCSTQHRYISPTKCYLQSTRVKRIHSV